MSTYFINASGANVTPYDTPAKGATNFHQLFDGGVIPPAPLVTFNQGDVVEVVSGPAIIENVNQPTMAIPTGVTVRSWSRNNARPFINLNKGLMFVVGGSVKGLDFYKDGGNVGMTVAAFIGVAAANVEIDSCLFKCVNVATWFRIPCISVSSAANCKVKNNVVVNNSGLAVTVSDSPNTEVVNNTIFNVLLDTLAPMGAINVNNTDDACQGTVIYNNIIYPNSTNATCAGINIIGVNLAQDYNCIFGIPNAYMGVAVAGMNNIHVDPLFAHDLSLKYTSPCVNRGAKISQYPSVPAVDFYGQRRPEAIDMGAIEMQGKLPSKGMGLGAIKVNGHLIPAAGLSKELVGTGGYDKSFTITA